MPYSGGQGKCEEWYVPHSKVGDKTRWTIYTDPGKCSGKGSSIKNVNSPKPGEPVYNIGKCKCNIDRYGQACEKTKIKMSAGVLPIELPGRLQRPWCRHLLVIPCQVHL